jgi:hypothetical protein
MCSPAINTPGLTPTLTPKKEKKTDLFVLQKPWRKNPCQKVVGGRGWRACGWIRWVLITNMC